MNGHLAKSFSIEKYFANFQDDDEINFDEFYETLSKWAVNDQTELTYEDFSAADANVEHE